MSTAVISLGANLDDPTAQVHAAAREIALLPDVTVTHRSRLFRTAPVGGPEQPDYVNAVVVVTTSRTPDQLLTDLQSIEARHGRVRDVRWGPRTLDLDLIAYDELCSQEPRLVLPHPRAHERAFVLAPWQDADPNAHLVAHGPVARLLDGVDSSDCAVLDGPRVGES